MRNADFGCGRPRFAFQNPKEREAAVIQAYVLIEAEPTRVQDLIKELPHM